MTPKEKAIYLYLMFKQKTFYIEVFHTPQLLDKFHNNAKDCISLCVKQILEEHFNGGTEYSRMRYKYWQEVKQEIEKL